MCKIRLSQSRIGTYKLCPKKYWYRYIKRMPVRDNWPHLVKGDFAHDTLELWVESLMHGDDPIKSMQQAYKTVCKREKYRTNPNLDKYVEEIKPWLRYVVRRYRCRAFMPLATEKRINFTYRDVKLTGRVDRIDQVDSDTVKIIDYKTNKNPKYLTNFQLGVYHLGVKYGSLSKQFRHKNVQTAYILLRHEAQEQLHIFTQTELEELLDEIECVADQILTDKTWEDKAKGCPLCNYCDYYTDCYQDDIDSWW